MAKYRKKPVVIDAFRPHLLKEEKAPEIPDWVMQALYDGTLKQGPGGTGFIVVTLEGAMLGLADDWLIRGVKGELYPCKPDIFAATYEPVEE